MAPLLTLLTLLAAAQPPRNPIPHVAAPPVEFGYWLSEGPVDPAHPDQVDVVEVWATWCAPCHETFPKLSRLQAEYGDRIRVIALTDDPADRVRRFFHAHREQMRFAIAVSNSEAVQSLMFGGFGGRALPSVYVMRDEVMLWSGHPDDLEAALQDLLPEPPAVWRAADAHLAAGGVGRLRVTQVDPEHLDLHPEAVDVTVVDAGTLAVGIPTVQRMGDTMPRVVIDVELDAAGLSGVDVPVTLEVGHHPCDDGTCHPRVTTRVTAYVHIDAGDR